MTIRNIIIALLLRTVLAGHYKGGTITWRPMDEFSVAASVIILIQEKHSWTYPRFDCNQALITSRGTYFDSSSPGTYPAIQCITGCSGASLGGYATINHITYCTDYNINTGISTGAYYVKQTLTRSTNIYIGYASSAWAGTIPIVGNPSAYGSASWSIMTHIDLTVNVNTTSGLVINSSPVTGSLGLIKVIRNRNATIQIPIADWNTGQTLRCRWASTTNECGDICGDLSQYGATIGASDCTMTWLAQLRPLDISSGYTTSTYVAAIMVEDFASSSSVTALSSVPLQMIIYVYTPAAGACATAPAIIGDRPNRACIGVPINVTLTERIVAEVYCNDTLSYVTEFVTTTPLWVNKTTVAPVAGTTNQFYITLTWTPVDDQYGPQVFCAAPIDGRGLTGSQYCINFVVGLGAPNLIQTNLVQGSASPIGTVFSNQSLFSIQSTQSVNRPNRNGTYISIYLLPSNTLVWQRDAGYSTDILYNGNTVLFIVQNASWLQGSTYYILFASGTASGTAFCGPESAPIISSTFWQFNIWNSAQSSTTTTTTTAPTTHTITTRAYSTIYVNNASTTTGIVTTGSTTGLTTTTDTTTSTSTTTETTTTTDSTTSTIPDASIFTAKDMENACKQPVAIATAVTFVVMMPLNMVGMYMMFTHLSKVFDPSKISAMVRHGQRLRKLRQK